MNKQSAVVTHEQIRSALRQFRRTGGHIVTMPPQPTPHLGRVAVHPQLSPQWAEADAAPLAMREAVSAALQ